MSERMYKVFTWDPETDSFTPQPGVPEGPYKLWELRKPLRQLREMGYIARKDDPSVLVQATNLCIPEPLSSEYIDSLLPTNKE